MIPYNFVGLILLSLTHMRKETRLIFKFYALHDDFWTMNKWNFILKNSPTLWRYLKTSEISIKLERLNEINS